MVTRANLTELVPDSLAEGLAQAARGEGREIDPETLPVDEPDDWHSDKSAVGRALDARRKPFSPTVWASAPVFIQSAIKEALTRRGQYIAMNLGSGCESGEHVDYIQIGAALKWLSSRVAAEEGT